MSVATEGVDKNLSLFTFRSYGRWWISYSLISFYITQNTQKTQIFSLLCDAGAGINAAYARGIHRDLTITNANTALAELRCGGFHSPRLCSVTLTEYLVSRYLFLSHAKSAEFAKFFYYHSLRPSHASAVLLQRQRDRTRNCFL